MSRIPSVEFLRQLGQVAFVLAVSGTIARAQDLAPRPDEQQLPNAMHSEMSERPTITVGRAGADLIGTDNRALQAGVDYVAGLGGGASRSARATTSCAIRYTCARASRSA